MKTNYLYLILFSVILFLIFRNPKESIEHFDKMDNPSFKVFMKNTLSYMCDDSTDGLPKWAPSKYNIKSFCSKYPSQANIDSMIVTLVEEATTVKNKSIKVIDSTILPVRIIDTNEVTKLGDNLVIKKAPIEEEKETLLTESIELIKKEPKYHFLAIGKNKRDGDAIFYGGNYSTIIKTPYLKNNSNFDLYEKIKTVEYSIESWIKIDNIDSKWRNIIHHGSKNSTRAPGIWIYPNTIKFGMAILTTKKRNSWGEWISFGSIQEIPLKRWCHMIITVSGKIIKCYINGVLLTEKTLSGFSVWPNKQKFYVVDPWYSSINFHLSKMRWYPFSIPKEYVTYLSESTFPLKKMDPKHSIINIKKPKLTLLGTWKIHNRKNFSPLEIHRKKDIVFMNGSITNSKKKLNQPCIIIDSNLKPDRIIKFIVYSSNLSNKRGGNIMERDEKIVGGLFLCTINSKGELFINDKNKNLSDNISRYVDGLNINLSNIQYSINKGVSVPTKRGDIIGRKNYEFKYTKNNTNVIFSGHLTNISNNKTIGYLPSDSCPPNDLIVTGVSDRGNFVYIKIFSNGEIKVLATNDNDVYLEGILFSTLPGISITTFYESFKKNKSNPPRITDSSGIISLNGLLGFGKLKIRNWSLKNQGCFNDKPYLATYDKLSATSCLSKQTIQGYNLTYNQCRNRCRKVGCKYFSRPSHLEKNQKGKCATSIVGRQYSNCMENIYTEIGTTKCCTPRDSILHIKEYNSDKNKPYRIKSLGTTINTTIQVWIKPNNAKRTRENFFHAGYAGEGTITLEKNGSLTYYYGPRGGNGWPYEGFNSRHRVKNGQIAHIAIVRDFTNKKIQWYVNGNLTNEKKPKFQYAGKTSWFPHIGKGYVNPYKGEFKHFRVYKRALNKYEINKSYEEGLESKKTDIEKPIIANKSSCAQLAKSRGHSIFTLQNMGKNTLCRTTDTFGEYGKTNTCNSTKCNNPEKCSGFISTTAYYLSDQWNLISRIPERLRPLFHTEFICPVYPKGYVIIVVTNTGYIYMNRIGTSVKEIQLDNICYLKD